MTVGAGSEEAFVAGSEIRRHQGLVPLRSAVICVIAFQLGAIAGVLAYLVHRNPSMALLTGGTAFVAAFMPLNEVIG